MSTFIIIGGGIGGLTTAIALQRAGLNAVVYESANEIRPLGAGLGLAGNAIKAFASIGIDKEIIGAGKEMRRMYGKDHRGKVISFTNSELISSQLGVIHNFTIHRADLHEVLLSLLQPGTLMLGKTLQSFMQDEKEVKAKFQDGSEVSADYLLACDGIHSAVRKQLVPGSLPRYAGYTCWRAVIDDLPSDFDWDEMSETWGPGKRFGIVPLTRNRVYWFATLNAGAQDQRLKAFTTKDLLSEFGDFHHPIQEILKRTRDEQLIWGDIIDLQPMNRFAFDRVLLMADAAHATTPNMGQGACMAIEDAATLAKTLLKYEPLEAFSRFERHRLPRTTWIVDQSWKFGKLAQWENRMGIAVRNSLLRLIPPSVVTRQLRSLYNVKFDC
ncbi:MAG: FAD-dependent monooxygenase [Bacteroidetes bacterium]|nr:FAD-dependent monooxygenase [Bacteroidota bacterium]